MVGAQAKRESVKILSEGYQISERRACKLLNFPRSSSRYRLVQRNDSEIKARIHYWAEKRPRYGSPRIHHMLLRDGLRVNHKRTERIYFEEGLSLRRKIKKRKYRSEIRTPLQAPVRANQIWAMDFVSDQFSYGGRFRGLTVIDVFTKLSPLIEVDKNLTGFKVIQALDRTIDIYGKPKVICVDNGPEFICLAMDKWASANGVQLNFSRRGKPTDNAYIESFNGKFRDECLAMSWFPNLSMAKKIIEDWRNEYNEERPHSSIGYLAPKEFAEKNGFMICI